MSISIHLNNHICCDRTRNVLLVSKAYAIQCMYMTELYCRWWRVSSSERPISITFSLLLNLSTSWMPPTPTPTCLLTYLCTWFDCPSAAGSLVAAPLFVDTRCHSSAVQFSWLFQHHDFADRASHLQPYWHALFDNNTVSNCLLVTQHAPTRHTHLNTRGEHHWNSNQHTFSRNNIHI